MRLTTRYVPALAGVLALTLLSAPSDATQLRFSISGGAIVWSDLVSDSIVAPLTVRPNVSPTVAVAAHGELGKSGHLRVRIAVSRGDLNVTERGSSVTVTTLTTWHPSIDLSQRLLGANEIHLNIGVLFFAPGDATGTLFSEGSPALPTAGIGLSRPLPLGGMPISLEANVDFHRFSTNSLRSAGFSGERTVGRVWLGISVGGG